jgi:hypothetical protein
VQYLKPVIEERLTKGERAAEKTDADMIQWLLDSAEGDQRTSEKIALRVLMINFAALHTTALVHRHYL